MCNRFKLLFLLFVCFLCCEFSEEDPQGPPDKSNTDKTNDADDDEVVSDYVSPVEEDETSKVFKIVPAPDLTKERDRRKGKVTVHVEIRDKGSTLTYSRGFKCK